MKKLLQVHQGSEDHWVGNGFPVSSVFGYHGLGRELSPFLLLDHAKPYSFHAGNERRGVGEHPHKGFETVTIVYQGEIEHRDSSGGGGIIGAGDVQWMTAGNGIVHEEFHSRNFTQRGGVLEMVQLWVNLSAVNKKVQPRYQALTHAEIPRIELPQGGCMRMIAGEYAGHRGLAKTYSPINLWDVSLPAGKSVELALPNGHTTAFLVLSGSVTVGGEREARDGDLAIFAREGDGIAVKSKTDAKLLIMGGEPIDEPMVGQGPFVMNTTEEIRQAMIDYQQGRMGQLADA